MSAGSSVTRSGIRSILLAQNLLSRDAPYCWPCRRVSESRKREKGYGREIIWTHLISPPYRKIDEPMNSQRRSNEKENPTMMKWVSWTLILWIIIAGLFYLYQFEGLAEELFKQLFLF